MVLCTGPLRKKNHVLDTFKNGHGNNTICIQMLASCRIFLVVYFSVKTVLSLALHFPTTKLPYSDAQAHLAQSTLYNLWMCLWSTCAAQYLLNVKMGYWSVSAG